MIVYALLFRIQNSVLYSATIILPKIPLFVNLKPTHPPATKRMISSSPVSAMSTSLS
jgi:hypothetical protein